MQYYVWLLLSYFNHIFVLKIVNQDNTEHDENKIRYIIFINANLRKKNYFICMDVKTIAIICSE